ncbi:MAG: hypothetical protein ACKVPY_11900 [Paracoccaceae bacterium]
MTRHIADRQAAGGAGSLARFAEVERREGAEGAHPAVKAVQVRPATREGGRRVAEFVRIERGREA